LIYGITYLSKTVIIRSVWLLILSAAYLSAVVAQDTIPTIIIEKLEDALENQAEDAEIDINNIADDLSYFSRSPIDLNKISEVQMEEMQILNSIQIQDFLSYRDIFGPFYSTYELQAIKSMDMETIREFLPYVKVSGNNEQKIFNLSDILSEGTSQVLFKWKRMLEDREGFESKDGEAPCYLGDPNHLFARYKFDYGQVFKMGLTGEKDPGEEFFTGSNSDGFDFYSGYIAARDITGWLKDVTLGDYTKSMGQGLILHNSFGGNKSSQVMNIKKGGRVIKPYSSVNEANQFRGASTTLGLHKNLNLSVFYSNSDANGTIRLDTTMDTGFSNVSSIIRDGFHRTENEIAKKNSVTLQSTGFALEYKLKGLGLSLNGLRTNFSLPLQPTQDLYRQYRFSGDQLTNSSIGYSYRWRNFNFFGEVAQSDNDGTAQVHGLLLGLDRKFDISFSYRNFDRDYQVLNANAFGEASSPNNEKGLYMGISIRPYKRWAVSAYVDMWRNPWLSFRRDAPARGVEYFGRIEYNIKRKLNVYMQYKYEEKLRNTNIETNPIDALGISKLHRLRVHLTHRVNKSITLKSRAEFSLFDLQNKTSRGSLFYQDFVWKPQGANYQITARYALFDTDNFDSRIYMYENDILYEFSIPFYQYKGSRYYIKAKYRFSRLLSAEMRVSRTHLNNRDTSGSAGQTINGPDKTEVKVLLKFRF